MKPNAPFGLEVRFDDVRRLAYLVYEETPPTVEEWCALMGRLLLRTSGRGFNLVSDRRRLVKAPTSDDIQRMTAYVATQAESFGNCRWAIVTRPESAEFGMARLASVYFANNSRIVLRPFTDMAVAERWASSGEDEPETER